jgi:hypothetical protein
MRRFETNVTPSGQLRDYYADTALVLEMRGFTEKAIADDAYARMLGA